MNRLVSIFAFTAILAIGNGQLGFAQVQILDGDGKQITPNEIPAETDQPTDEAPQIDPQIFGGNGSSIIIRKSFSSVDENGDLKTESSGKAIVIGPDGKKQEFDLQDGENMELNIGPMRIRGLIPGPVANGQAESFSLGVKCKPVHPAVASQLNLETGMMVSSVRNGSPAATAGIQQYDVLLYADDKQLNRQSDLSKAVNAAGEADANISLTLIRGGKEISVAVKPEKGVADQMKAGPMNGMPQDLFDFEADGLFGEDALGKGMEARMRKHMERMQERADRMQQQLRDGLIELPPARIFEELR